MCGIAGVFLKDQMVKRDRCLQMIERLHHRGPDTTGVHFEDKVFLGHKRLSILDLSEAGNQPMWDAQKQVGIVFNGEIYNFQELREELSQYPFHSRTDTEVLIYGYKEWGIEKLLAKINGMFAFCIYDRTRKKIVCARDRVGIKPFVYYQDDRAFVFASELKALDPVLPARKINQSAIAQYFLYRYIPNPQTIFENVFKLDPGHYIEINLQDFDFRKQCYWELKPELNDRISENEAVEYISSLIKDSVKKRLIADTEVASFLSGGIDSCLITNNAKAENPLIKSFTIDLDPPQYSEASYARFFASQKEIDLKVKKVSAEDFQANFDKLITFYDEPFADSSLVPTYLLCKFVHDEKIKVALSGDGGDELFWGYRWYKDYDNFERLKFLKIFPENFLKLFKKIPYLKRWFWVKLNPLERYRRIMFDRFTVNEVENLFGFKVDLNETTALSEKLGSNHFSEKQMNYLDFKTFLTDDILYKVDIASMAHSLEVRVPFLDHRLIEAAFSLGKKLLYKNQTLKYMLKKVAAQDIPRKNIQRPKQGFSAPVVDWIGRDLRKQLKTGALVKSGLISRVALNRFAETESSKGKLWQMYIFQKWVEAYQ